MKQEDHTSSPAAQEAWEIMRELVLNNERRREASNALGMSFVRIKALRRIDESPMSMGELASSLSIDAPYMTLVVDDLERQGFVERKPHPQDRRAKMVVATRNGKRAAQKARAILQRPPAELAALPGDQLVALLGALRAAHPAPVAVAVAPAPAPAPAPVTPSN
jgi:DNA-binding MarR family transcriptional regulator